MRPHFRSLVPVFVLLVLCCLALSSGGNCLKTVTPGPRVIHLSSHSPISRPVSYPVSYSGSSFLPGGAAGTLLISTIDGRLHALDLHSGTERWALQASESLVRSSAHLSSDGDSPLIIPAVDGSLFYSGDRGLERLPISIPDIVSASPFRTKDNSRYIGTKSSQLFLVNRFSGEIRGAFTSEGEFDKQHHKNNQAENEEEFDSDEDSPFASGEELIWIGRSSYSVSSIGGASARQQWNVSLHQFFSLFEDSTRVLAFTDLDPYGLPHIGVSINGTVFHLDTQQQRILWSNALESPVASIHFVRDPQPRAASDDASSSEFDSSSSHPFFALSTSDTLKLPFFYFHSSEPSRDPRCSSSAACSIHSPNDSAWAISEYFRAIEQFNRSILVHVASAVDGSLIALPNPNRFPPGSEMIAASQFRSAPGQPMGIGIGSLGDLHYGLSVSDDDDESMLCSPESPSFPGCLAGSHSLPLFPSTHQLSLLTDGADKFIMPAESLEPQAVFAPPINDPRRLIGYSQDGASLPWHSNRPASWVQSSDWIIFVLANVLITLAVARWVRRDRARHSASAAHSATANNIPQLDQATSTSNPPSQSPPSSPLSSGDSVSESTSRSSSGSSASSDSVTGSVSPLSPSAYTSGGTVTIGKLTIFSETVLGTGSMGTVVFAGQFEGRSCAIKRLVKPFFGHGNADKEIALLMQSDEHPNVLRYYAREEDHAFIYIALELCHGSFMDVIESPQRFPPSILSSLDRKRLLHNFLNALSHLHSLNIIHRDLKPANILLTEAGKCKLADLGLGKQLDSQRSSFDSTFAGSVGWQPQEILALRNTGAAGKELSTLTQGRLTKAVDCFSAGCIIYYFLTDGSHPFGQHLERELNIAQSRIDLAELRVRSHPTLSISSAEATEARDLVLSMVEFEPAARISASDAMAHPFFWSAEQKLQFLIRCSDRVESEPEYSELRQTLERFHSHVVGAEWQTKVSQSLLENLGKYRKYDFTSICDLLRVIRNKHNHYRDLPSEVQLELGPIPAGFLNYFTSRFPTLLLFSYHAMASFVMERENSSPFGDPPLYAFHPADQLDTFMQNAAQEKWKSSVMQSQSGFLNVPIGEFPTPHSNPLSPVDSPQAIDSYRLNPPFKPFYESLSLRRLLHFQSAVRLKYRPWFQPEETWQAGKRMSAVGNQFSMVEPSTEAKIMENQRSIARIRAAEREEREREREREAGGERDRDRDNILFISPSRMNFNHRANSGGQYPGGAGSAPDSGHTWRRGNHDHYRDRDQFRDRDRDRNDRDFNQNWRN